MKLIALIVYLSKDIEDIKALLLSGAGRLDLERIRSAVSQLLDDRAMAELDELIQTFGSQA